MLHWKERGKLEVKKERPNREEDRRGGGRGDTWGKQENHCAG